MRLFIQTFGCQMNVADSQEMSRHLALRGLTPTLIKEEADVVVVNTCTVRQHAEDKAFSFIGRMKDWKKQNPERILVVAGCSAERLKKHFKRRFHYIDIVTGAKSIEEFPDVIDAYLKKRPHFSNYNWFRESEKSFGQGDLRTSGKEFVLGEEDKTSFVTVMRGCNYSCSYCIVPSVRGREKYRSADAILDEVSWKAAQGARKVMLLGQTVNSYWFKERAHNGETKITDFSDLIFRVNQMKDVDEIRFMSPHPHYMTNKLIRTLSSCEKISPEIHLPVQSGSDRILKKMRRNYTRQEYLSIASDLKQAVPKLKLGTDFIVGFPGETEEDFEASLSLAEEAQFTLAYCFKYSARAGTESFDLKNDVSRATKEKRLHRLLEKTKQPKALEEVL